ncbi:hypothetical protein DICPUDRAFT_77125 [Dictyostelium purpureum]|uniref:Auto-transporter adhesin head GIN domain-containing protein n=1 Tax=Dictyostelium purpureum TaxID=5786 RepID=F0ZFN8_DICPU|nr:uncharacterized protein DICPUDRAFT_77125 [Dictyostelium purpureum]EGC37266.1 hypothetical protein DICPUDRAFT_77125 [Dictyostelium purpureum]|eukprot:XP_003286236.1 hypothetical protein DICPUDRAFT_77125 [Dictyostelium purpureum]
MIKNNKNILLLILFFNIKLIICSTVTFNNSIISQCTNNNPCDLSISSSWENNQVPINGDDVLIDLSNFAVNYNIYLIANNFNVELNSFYLYGQQKGRSYQGATHLTINNSNLTVSDQFNIQGSVLNINETEVYNRISINSFISNQTYVTLNGNSNIECNTIEMDGENFNINGDSMFTVNGAANFELYVYHQSNQLFKTMGTTYFSNPFQSNSTVQFDGQTVFSSSSTMNTVFSSGQISIINGYSVDINDYIQGSESAFIALSQGSSLRLQGSINSHLFLNNEILLADNSLLLIKSGFTISNISTLMNGTIYINDSAFPTTILDVNQTNLNIITQSNLTITSSTLNQVTVVMDSLILNIQNVSIFTSLNSQGQLNIEPGASLTLLNSSSSYSTVDIFGSLTVQDYLYAHAINIDTSGSLYCYGQVDAPVNTESGSIFYKQSTTARSIDIQKSGTLSLNNTELYIKDNFTMGPKSLLQFSSVGLNNGFALIEVGGYTNIQGPISITIRFKKGLISTENNDEIFLFSTNFFLPNVINFTSSDIVFITDAGGASFDYKIVNSDNGDISLVFNKNSGFASWKVSVIIFSVVGAIIIFCLLVFYFKRRGSYTSIGSGSDGHHHHSHHHHYSSSSHHHYNSSDNSSSFSNHTDNSHHHHHHHHGHH